MSRSYLISGSAGGAACHNNENNNHYLRISRRLASFVWSDGAAAGALTAPRIPARQRLLSRAGSLLYDGSSPGSTAAGMENSAALESHVLRVPHPPVIAAPWHVQEVHREAPAGSK